MPIFFFAVVGPTDGLQSTAGALLTPGPLTIDLFARRRSGTLAVLMTLFRFYRSASRSVERRRKP